MCIRDSYKRYAYKRYAYKKKGVNDISEKRKFVEDNTVRKKEITLNKNLQHVDSQLLMLKNSIKECHDIKINPKIGISILQGNLAKISNLLNEICLIANSLNKFLEDEKIK